MNQELHFSNRNNFNQQEIEIKICEDLPEKVIAKSVIVVIVCRLAVTPLGSYENQSKIL